MRITDYITTAQTNLLRTKLRTFLTILAFVIGTFTLAMTTAFGQGLQAYVTTQLNAYGQPNQISVSVAATANQASSSGVAYYQPHRQATSGGRRDGIGYTLNTQDLAKVKAIPHVIGAYPNYAAVSIAYVQQGSSPKYVLDAQTAIPGDGGTLAAGVYPGANDADSIVLPYPYVEAMGYTNAGQLVGKIATLHIIASTTNEEKDFTATISGVLPDTLKVPGAFVSSQLMSSIVEFQTGSAGAYSDIQAITDSSSKQVRGDVKQVLQSKGYTAQTYDDLIQSFSNPLHIIQYGLDGFAAIALLAATIGIVNTLLMSVLERTQEIGLLKALGMRRRGITVIYLVEAASIGFWGGVIGVAFGNLVGVVLNHILARTLFKGAGVDHLLSYPLTYMAAIIGGAMIIGLLAGTLPAIRAGRLDPIDALRRE